MPGHLKHELSQVDWMDCDYYKDLQQHRKRNNAEEEGSRLSKRSRREKREGDADYINFLDQMDANVEMEEEHKDGEDDPDYAIFLANLRQHQHSYIYQSTKQDGTPIFVLYEQQDEDDEDPKEDEDEEPKEDEDDEEPKKDDDEPNEPMLNVNAKGEAVNQTETDIESCPFLEDCDPENIAAADTHYLMLLSRCQVKGHSLIFHSPEGVFINFALHDAILTDEEGEEQEYQHKEEENHLENEEEEEEVEEEEEEKVEVKQEEEDWDCQHFVDKFIPITTPKSCVPIDLDTDDDHTPKDHVTLQTIDASEFGQQLIKKLKEPFKQKEYYSLQEEARKKRPLEQHRDFRGGRDQSYPTEKTGSSYFDHYQDLAKMVKLAELHKDDKGALLLLRGLFFFLEHRCNEGNFMPWKEPYHKLLEPMIRGSKCEA